ncbi:MAG: VWA domain-containing protein [Pseudomonadota bacterium]
MSFRFVTAFLLLLAAPLAAQDRANTILVLDGSGSMWGQIEGVNKIVIAREVVGTLLEDFPAEQNLGLTVYGHRTRGDCSDIETVVAPGQGTLGAIRDAVNGINPRGRTPMTDAIINAAQALRYTEEAATVILVSDGIETCNPDPCAAATALEEAGIDFTAHVVGFDVTDPEALAQMQCLAGNTGGQFLTASNAAELGSALTQVAVAPEPVMGQVTFVAREGTDGPLLEDVSWAVVSETGAGDAVFTGSNTLTLREGSYGVAAQWAQTSETVRLDLSVTGQDITLEVVFEPLPDIVPVTFRAVLGEENGPLVEGPVEWTLGNGASQTGNPLQADFEEGSYTVTAYWLAAEAVSDPRQFIAIPGGREVVIVFEKPALTATLTAPATAPAGSTIEVAWAGPGAEGDLVAVTDASRTDVTYPYRYANTAEAAEGSPLSLLMPTTPGDYVVEYSLGAGDERIGAIPITLTEPPANITAPDTVTAGARFEVAWEGPAYPGDKLGVTAADAEDAHYPYRFDTSTVPVAEGATLTLQAPTQTGQYVVEYAYGQDSRRLIAVALEVVEVAASLTAPESVEAGATFEVAWTGPGYDRDKLGITRADYEDASYPYRFSSDTADVADGSPLRLTAPTEPGAYVVEYVLGQDSSRLVAVALEVTDIGASITAPGSVPAGSRFEVAWTGPAYARDKLGITAADADDITWPYRFAEDTADVSGGPTLTLLAPTQPGEYVIEYVLGQDSSRLVSVPLTVTELTATLTSPAEAPAGSRVEVSWTGPGYARDKLGITAADYEDIAWPYRFAADETPVSEGAVVDVQLPTAPGAYVLEYVLGQDSSRLASVPITVTPVSATITAPASGPAGGQIEIAWEGPGYQRDFIGITPSDYEDIAWPYRFAERTRDLPGPVVSLTLPDAPGEYVLEYVFGLDNSRLMAVPITVTE